MPRHAQLDPSETPGLRDAQSRPASVRVGIAGKPAIRGVEVEKILSFHGEHYGSSVRGLRAEESLAIGPLEQEVQEAQGARRFGRDA